MAAVLGSVKALHETPSVVGDGDDADDVAIWVDPIVPSKSVIFGTSKYENGGLFAYDLQGNLLSSHLGGSRYNNVDLRYGFDLGGSIVDLIGVSNTSDDTFDFFTFDARSATFTRLGTVQTELQLYGFTMAKFGETYYAIGSTQSGQIRQFAIDGSSGEFKATLVRDFQVGSQAEGMVVHEPSGSFYVSEENVGVWKYSIDPGTGARRVLIDAANQGHLQNDIEGLAIYDGADSDYLIVSSQGDHSYGLYDVATNAYLGSFRIGEGDNIDAVQQTDGLEVTSANLGGGYRDGMLAVHDHENPDSVTSNYKLVAWTEVAELMGLSAAITGVSAPDLAGAADTGLWDADNLTSVARPVLAGTAKAGSSVTLFEGSTVLGSGIASSTGRYSIALAADLSAGTHVLRAKATDTAGETTEAPGVLVVTIDRSGPAIEITGCHGGAVRGTAEVGTLVQLYAADGSTAMGGPVMAASDGSWSVTTSVEESTPTTFRAIATDNAGNSTASDSLTVLISSSGIRLTGDDNRNVLAGGDRANVLFGLDGDDQLSDDYGYDRLDGGTGKDSMSGGRGNDTYIVDDAGDVVIENSTSATEIDRVETHLSYELGANLETLTLTGSSAIRGMGNSLSNVVTGNAAANTLSGGAGNDTLVGGAGRDTLSGGADKDTFRYVTGQSGIASTTADNVVGWLAADDAFDFAVAGSSTNYYEAGTNAANVEAAATAAERLDTSARDYMFLYNGTSKTGYLLADLDNNEVFETGVVLAGMGAAANFAFGDIL